MIAEQLPTITQLRDLVDGWQLAEVYVDAEPWPGFAWVLVSPAGDVVIMGDGAPESIEFGPADVEQAEHDVAWARRVLGKPIATWQLGTVTS